MEPKKIKNPTGMLIMHGTVIAVVLYMAWQLVRSYRAGGAEAPCLTTLSVGLVLLVGGCVVVGWLAVRLFLQAKREEKALEQEATHTSHALHFHGVMTMRVWPSGRSSSFSAPARQAFSHLPQPKHLSVKLGR